jgi:hypothetical protein
MIQFQVSNDIDDNFSLKARQEQHLYAIILLGECETNYI